VEATPELELMSPASLGVICFRRRGAPGESEEQIAARNAALVGGFERTGQGLVSSTRLRGRYAIRLCVMNHTSAEEHVTGALDWFARAEPSGAEEPAEPASSPRHAVMSNGGWLGTPEVAPGDLADLPLFDSLDAEDLVRVASWGREMEVRAGEEVTKRWDAARDFYVILAGRAAVERDGEMLGELGRGDFFGELAALDWGAGYGYARLATVTAVDHLRLLVLAPAHLSQLMAKAPSVERLVRSAVRERLPAAAG
jgi:hypothetical protein